MICKFVNTHNILLLTDKGDWVEDEGCITSRLDRYFVRCDCNHLSIFGVLAVNITVQQQWFALISFCVFNISYRTQIQLFVGQVRYPTRIEQLVSVCSLKICLASSIYMGLFCTYACLPTITCGCKQMCMST